MTARKPKSDYRVMGAPERLAQAYVTLLQQEQSKFTIELLNPDDPRLSDIQTIIDRVGGVVDDLESEVPEDKRPPKPTTNYGTAAGQPAPVPVLVAP